MKLMKLFSIGIFLMFSSVSLAGAEEGAPGSAANAQDGKSASVQPGYLVVSVSASHGTQYYSYRIKYRKKGETKDDDVEYVQDRSIPFLHRPDFRAKDEHGSGVVEVVKLPPGEYEFFNFNVYFANGMFQRHWWSKQDFSIPFTIKPGEATYAGCFRAEEISEVRNSFHHDGAYFVLNNQQQRDLALAQRKKLDPQIKVNVEIADPERVGNPFIKAARVHLMPPGTPVTE